MKKYNVFVSILVIIATILSNSSVVTATTVDSYKEQLDELEKEQEEAEAQKDNLANQVEKISNEMLEAQEQITEIYMYIKEVDIELALAMIEKENQYEWMKTRIKYMYENQADTSMLSILFSTTNLTELLNKVEYANQVTNYDRQKLDEFQNMIIEIQEKELNLKKENERLEELQTELSEKKDEVEVLLAKAQYSVDELGEEIVAVSKALVKAAEEEERKKQELADSANSSTGTAGDSLVSGNGIFAHPIPGYNYISSPYGYRYYPDPNVPVLHKGTDFAASTGTPVYAAADGVVTISQYSSSAGYYISINHGNGLVTLYMHNSKLLVKAGQTVTKGQNISLSGNTGSSSGPHLHFQVMLNGTAVNSTNYL